MGNRLNYFLNPGSVAVIGASTRTGPENFNIVEVMKSKGCRGKIYPVNPKATEILGFKAYPSILDIPGEVDLAIITTAREAVTGLVRQCVEKPVKGIIVISQGFADAGEEGKVLQEKIMALVAGTGIRVMGPNTLGVINNFDTFLSAFVNVPVRPSPVGLICQSGLFINSHVDTFGGLGYGVDIGNSADLGFNEVLEFYGREERIEVISLHMEGVKGGRRFMELGREIAAKKPVIVYKTGRTAGGAQAAGSHSGSLAGEDHVYEAAFRQSGLIRAETLDELRDFTRTFSSYKSVPGNRMAVVTFSGGGGIALLDAMDRCGLVPASFSPETVKVIRSLFPDWLEVSNPLDIWPSVMKVGFESAYQPVLKAIMDDPGVDMMVCISVAHQVPGDGSPYMEKFALEAALRRPDKPVAIWVSGSGRQQMAEHIGKQGPVVVYFSPERMARSLGVLHRYYQMRPGMGAAASPETARSGVSALPAGKAGALLGNEAMEIITKSGIPAVRGKIAGSLEEALKAAKDIGYPLALKVVSPEIIHKTEAGGVILDVRDPAALERGYRSLMDRTAERMPGALIEGVLIQEFAAGGVELILGARRDSEFGPVLVFGLGGIYAEVLKDVAFRIAPVTAAVALEMVRETKAYQVLRGARGKEPADLEALVRAIVSLSDLVYSHPEISEIDINPLLAMPGGVLALDSRIIIS